MEDEQFLQIKKQVLRRIKPPEDEVERVSALADSLITICEECAKELGLRVTCTLVGSVARGTWLKEDHDFDMFILFPPSTSWEELEELGLEIGRRAAHRFASMYKGSAKVIERYADHPYIQLVFEDGEVDFVPAYYIDDASRIISAVDRTPHHTRYVLSHIAGKEDEVRLLKQFFKAAGIYGSELKRRGYSGYLCELLVIHYGSFLECIKAMANWRRGTVIDIEKHSTKKHDEPLVVVDPVDPKRNVAAALSLDNFARSIHCARAFLSSPSISFFEIEEEEPSIDPRRKMGLLALEFSRPELVDDVLYPQIYHAMDSVASLLEREGFRVYSKRVGERGEYTCMLFELEVWELPPIKKHMGPPVDLKDHAEKFLARYRDNPRACSEVYIENGKYCVDLRREHQRADALLAARLRECSLGKHLKKVLTERAVVLFGEDVVRRGRVFRYA